MNKEDLKAWLGLNMQDTLLNLSAIPFLLGFVSSELVIVLFFFGITYLLATSGIVLYFRNRNTKISNKTAYWNKYLSLGVVILVIFLMIFKVLYLVFTH